MPWMTWEVEYTNEFGNWWDSLTRAERRSISAGVELLEENGPRLGFPFIGKGGLTLMGGRHKFRALTKDFTEADRRDIEAKKTKMRAAIEAAKLAEFSTKGERIPEEIAQPEEANVTGDFDHYGEAPG